MWWCHLKVFKPNSNKHPSPKESLLLRSATVFHPLGHMSSFDCNQRLFQRLWLQLQLGEFAASRDPLFPFYLQIACRESLSPCQETNIPNIFNCLCVTWVTSVRCVDVSPTKSPWVSGGVLILNSYRNNLGEASGKGLNPETSTCSATHSHLLKAVGSMKV